MATETPVSADPRTRPAEPEHPMMLNGQLMPGDLAMMIRCILEELLMIGTAPDELRQMTHDPNFQALFAARHALGDQVFDDILEETFNRIGRHHVRTHEFQGDSKGVSLTINATSAV